jgi:molecular chaperone GrpE
MHGHEEQHQPAVEQDEAPVPAEATDEERVEQDLGELLAKAQAEREEYLALAQRTQADFENYRKRMARETAVAESRGIAKVVKEILPAVDNLELALQAAGDDEVAEGFRLVRNEFLAALARLGIEPFSPEGQPFDPSEHEAMSQQPVEGVETGTVASVYQQGYRIDGTVLRPARVVVAA